MFLFNDTQFQLDLHHQRAAELRAEARAHRLARAAAGTPGSRRTGRWHRGGRRPHSVTP